MSYPGWFDAVLEKIERARDKVMYGAAAASSPVLVAVQQLEAFRRIDDPEAKVLMEEICGKSLVQLNEHLPEIVQALEKHGLANSACQLKVLDAYEAAAKQRGCNQGCEEPVPTLGE